jgi:hypothetical protein
LRGVWTLGCGGGGEGVFKLSLFSQNVFLYMVQGDTVTL